MRILQNGSEYVSLSFHMKHLYLVNKLVIVHDIIEFFFTILNIHLKLYAFQVSFSFCTFYQINLRDHLNVNIIRIYFLVFQFFEEFNSKLLSSPNYVTRRQAIKVMLTFMLIILIPERHNDCLNINITIGLPRTYNWIIFCFSRASEIYHTSDMNAIRISWNFLSSWPW